MDVLVATNLHKRYGATTAVTGVDLTVESGEVVAVLGPNGAGKTTTIEMLLGYAAPTSVGCACSGRGRTRPTSAAGAMLQDTTAPASMRVAELVRLVGRYHPYALPLDDVLARADLAPQRRARVGDLSGGQRQRLWFALAITGDPDLLFLDEPTVAMDVDARRGFWQQVRAMTRLGKTVLFSTHYLVEADAVADRVVVLHHGRVLIDGTPAAIKARVAGKTVQLATDAPLTAVRGIDGVEHAEVDHVPATRAGLDRLVVRTRTPERLLAELAAAGRIVDDLTVTDTDLERAFVHLTRDDAQEVAA